MVKYLAFLKGQQTGSWIKKRNGQGCGATWNLCRWLSRVNVFFRANWYNIGIIDFYSYPCSHRNPRTCANMMWTLGAAFYLAQHKKLKYRLSSWQRQVYWIEGIVNGTTLHNGGYHYKAMWYLGMKACQQWTFLVGKWNNWKKWDELLSSVSIVSFIFKFM